MKVTSCQLAGRDESDATSSDMNDETWIFRVINYLDTAAEWANLSSQEFDGSNGTATDPSHWAGTCQSPSCTPNGNVGGRTISICGK